MLLHLISITFVVYTAEISEFHAFFLCLSRSLENFSLVSFGACDNFSLPLVVVSLSMSQTRGSCGHLKGSYIPENTRTENSTCTYHFLYTANRQIQFIYLYLFSFLTYFCIHNGIRK